MITMWHIVGGSLVVCFLLILVYFVRQEGKKSERLEALKREAKERAREQRINNFAYSLTADDARRRLHDVANKK